MAKSKLDPNRLRKDGKTLLNNYIQNIKDGARNPSIAQPTKAQQHEAEAKKQGGTTTNPGGRQVIGMAAVSVSSGPGKVSAGGSPSGRQGAVEYRPIYGPAPKHTPSAPPAAQAAPTPAPEPYKAPASVTEARERAQQVAYSPDRQPKLFPDGTPVPYDSTGQVARGANDQGAWNAEYSLAQKNIGDMAAENFDRQLANFGSGLPKASTPSASMGDAFAVIQRYKRMFG